MSKRIFEWTNILVTMTTLIFAITSLITVYITITSWKEERESSRPYLTFKESPTVQINDQELVFKFDFVNVGSHPAVDLSSLTLVFDNKLKEKPIHIDQYALVNQIPYHTATSLLINIKQSDLVPSLMNIDPYFFILDLQYDDPIIGKTYHQTLYLRWHGMVKGQPQSIFHAEVQEKKEILDYLKRQNIDPQMDRWNIF